MQPQRTTAAPPIWRVTCPTDLRVSAFCNHEFLKIPADAGYSPKVAEAVAVFQVNGCFKAVKRYGDDEATWREARDAIDAFICGGLEACRQIRIAVGMGKK